MLDDLLDVFDRDRPNRDRNAHSQRGVRGFLARLTGDHEPGGRSPRPRRQDDEDDALDRDSPSRRRRRDDFDLDD